MNQAFSKILILVIFIILVAGGIFAWQYFGPSEKAEEKIANWRIYSNEEYGFEIKYPEDWKVAKNVLTFEPNLVFCPDNLATDLDPEIVCKMIGGGAGSLKPTYETGMIYLFAYDTNPKPTNPNYHYLGFGGTPSKYYYLSSDGNEAEINQMLSTFSFIEVEEPYIEVLSPNGGEEWIMGNSYEIKWQVVGLEGENVKLSLALPGHGWIVIDTIAASSEEYSWKIPSDISSGEYKISITWPAEVRMSQVEIGDESDDYFSIFEIDETADWQIYRNEGYGFEFKYPEGFFHQEPEVKISDCDNVNFPDECPEIETTPAPFPPTEEKTTINNVPFCLKKTSEGAAGSIYISYYYTTIKDKKCLTMYLVLRYTNCGVFGSPGEEAYQECEHENKVTKSETLNQILSTFRFSE